jgi:hypothetical protein
MTSAPLGTIIVLLFWRPVSRGRSAFLGLSFSSSDDDELAADGGLARPSTLEFEAGAGSG